MRSKSIYTHVACCGAPPPPWQEDCAMSNNAAAGQETAVEEVVRSTAWAEWYDSRENQLFLVYLVSRYSTSRGPACTTAYVSVTN